jgi:hypothetical protein
MERFYLKKINEVDVKEQYLVTIRNTFAALENLEDSGDISRAWDSISLGIGYCESKHHKLWLDQECSKLVDQRKQAKLHWLQNPSKVNE